MFVRSSLGAVKIELICSKFIFLCHGINWSVSKFICPCHQSANCSIVSSSVYTPRRLNRYVSGFNLHCICICELISSKFTCIIFTYTHELTCSKFIYTFVICFNELICSKFIYTSVTCFNKLICSKFIYISVICFNELIYSKFICICICIYIYYLFWI
jgi:hypothetical protein